MNVFSFLFFFHFFIRSPSALSSRREKMNAGEAVYAVSLYDMKEGNGKSRWGPKNKPYYEVDPSTCGNHLKYLNHTCGEVACNGGTKKQLGPNVAKAFVHLPGAAAPSLVLFTARDVDAGEELLWNYFGNGANAAMVGIGGLGGGGWGGGKGGKAEAACERETNHR